jgi:GTP-binding protein
VLDLNPLDGSDPAVNHATVEREIEQHDPRLAALPRVLALSKADLVDAGAGERERKRWQERLGPEVPVILTSSVSGAGLGSLSTELLRQVPARDEIARTAAAGDSAPAGELAEHRVFRPADSRSYRVRRTGEGTFTVDGAGIERLVARYDLDNEEALAHLERRLRGIGVLRALEAQGFEAGDEVQIAGVVFELDPDM